MLCCLFVTIFGIHVCMRRADSVAVFITVVSLVVINTICPLKSCASLIRINRPG